MSGNKGIGVISAFNEQPMYINSKFGPFCIVTNGMIENADALAAQLLNLAQFQPFTQPIVRIDLDRNDDNDNRLFGVTAQIAWTPKPAYQLIVRTPLYAIRN